MTWTLIILDQRNVDRVRRDGQAKGFYHQ